ncbi:uncharacterized protein LOC131000158 [Salvia miltiorrhiza]|uniref:uncharacterized protein LOC131000158 n=1 Tax=Salvia miltiorrhiza TaxID=226208 RepID=UPI0025AB8B48|nr:uncharacterized protein LOC131000158 [Salvia miltiorrhiza]
MRDLASCLSEHAVQVSDTSCSSYTNIAPCIASASTPSIQISVKCLYRSILSNEKQMMTTVTWSRSASAHGLTLSFHDDPSAAFKISTSSRLFRKSKGRKSLQLRSSSSKIDLFWDLSTARYEPGPEPVDGFYVAVVVDSELGLVLGDKDHELAGKKAGKFALVSRQEHFSGSTVCATKARFCDGGGAHDISIRCGGESQARHPILSVCIDKKPVIRVKKLQWNFRGNQTIFLDGLLVDLLWDVHDWFHNPDAGYAVFMFKTRSGLESRLWLHDDKIMRRDDDRLDFSFMICACKNV